MTVKGNQSEVGLIKLVLNKACPPIDPKIVDRLQWIRDRSSRRVLPSTPSTAIYGPDGLELGECPSKDNPYGDFVPPLKKRHTSM